MHALIVTFELDGIDDAAYRELAAQIAPVFRDVPGLVSKTWLAAPEHNTYGGIYFFADAASLAAYLGSDIVRGMTGNPNFRNLSLDTFGTIDAANQITASPAALAHAV